MGAHHEKKMHIQVDKKFLLSIVMTMALQSHDTHHDVKKMELKRHVDALGSSMKIRRHHDGGQAGLMSI